MEPSEATLISLYSELQKLEANNDYEKAINVAEKSGYNFYDSIQCLY